MLEAIQKKKDPFLQLMLDGNGRKENTSVMDKGSRYQHWEFTLHPLFVTDWRR